MRDSYSCYKNKLEGTYLETFDKIELYCMTSTMELDIQEELLLELIDVFLTAQEQQRPVERIVGNNIESFCKNFCSGIGYKYQIKKSADIFKRISWLVLIISILDIFIFSEETPLFEIQSDIVPILMGCLSGVMLSILSSAIFRTVMFRSKKINMKMYNITVALSFFVFVGGGIIIARNQYMNVHSWVLILITGIYLIIYYIMKRLMFMDFYKSRKIRFTDKVIEEMPQAWYKRMVKKNTKLIKKGKEPMTSIEFTRVLQKENRFNKWICIGSWLIFWGMYIGFAIVVGMNSAPLNTLLFMIVMAIVYIPIAFWFQGCNRLSMWQKNTLDLCVKQEIDLFSYIEQQKDDAELSYKNFDSEDQHT